MQMFSTDKVSMEQCVATIIADAPFLDAAQCTGVVCDAYGFVETSILEPVDSEHVIRKARELVALYRDALSLSSETENPNKDDVFATSEINGQTVIFFRRMVPSEGTPLSYFQNAKGGLGIFYRCYDSEGLKMKFFLPGINQLTKKQIRLEGVLEVGRVSEFFPTAWERFVDSTNGYGKYISDPGTIGIPEDGWSKFSLSPRICFNPIRPEMPR